MAASHVLWRTCESLCEIGKDKTCQCILDQAVGAMVSPQLGGSSEEVKDGRSQIFDEQTF